MATGGRRSLSVYRSYQLKESDCNKQISGKHLDEIARSYCREWKKLRSALKMKAIIEHDLEHSAADEGGKRRDFLFMWRDGKGSDATFKALIDALLEIECVEEAEGVCRLLQQWTAAEDSQESQPACNSSTGAWLARLYQRL